MLFILAVSAHIAARMRLEQRARVSLLNQIPIRGCNM
jgi:hypothetical protein